jgi:hypothetical protein
MNARTLIAALGLAVSMAAAHANGTPAAQPDASKALPPAPAASVSAAADADRKICRQERPMGSLIPTRICKTAAQWESEREQSRKMIQDMQQRTGSTSNR